MRFHKYILTHSAAAAAVTPATYTNLSAWWDAANLAYADATPIDNASAKWTDRSSNNNHLIQATAANRPQLKTSIINGKNIVRFDGSSAPNNDKLAFTSAISIATNGDFTIIIVGLVTAESIIVGYTASTLSIQVRRYYISLEKIFVADSAVNSHQSSLFSTAHGSVHAMIVRRTGNNITIRENKTDRSNGSFASSAAFPMDTIGTTDSGGTVVPLKGDIGEIIIYSAYRSDAECDNLYDNFLKTKWGLP
jgi:hypothetical protein